MFENFITVFSQVIVLFIFMFIGLFFGKTDLVSEKATRGITNLLTYVVIPCTLIRAFQFRFDPVEFREFLFCFAIAAGIHIATFLAAHFLVFSKNREERQVLVLLSVISNCNFIAFPLQLSILGEKGIFLGSAYSAVCALFNWTFGMIYMTGRWDKSSLKNITLNPSLIGFLIGFILYLTSFTLPSVISSTVEYAADLAVPLPMILIGVMLTQANFKTIIRDFRIWQSILLRLVVFPLATLGVLVLLGIRGEVLTATLIEAAPPSATIVVILASMLHRGEDLAAAGCSLSTVVSLFTMPFIISFAQTLA
ncbi:MAG: AEC family transporter [Eubacteriales bacterium]|nr:AEC family transporter [Eubacteriales bacterium]